MVAMMAGKRRGGVMVDGEESGDISKEKGEESGNEGRIQGEDSAEISMAGYKQVEDLKGGWTGEEVGGSDSREKTTLWCVFTLLQSFTQAKDETK